jgi:hypothetical protein
MRENLYAISPAVILAHAERLASLVDVTTACAQCVKLIARDIEDNGALGRAAHLGQLHRSREDRRDAHLRRVRRARDMTAQSQSSRSPRVR